MGKVIEFDRVAAFHDDTFGTDEFECKDRWCAGMYAVVDYPDTGWDGLHVRIEAVQRLTFEGVTTEVLQFYWMSPTFETVLIGLPVDKFRRDRFRGDPKTGW